MNERVNKVAVSGTARGAVKIVHQSGGPEVAGTGRETAMMVAARVTAVARKTTTMQAHTTDMACLPAKIVTRTTRTAGIGVVTTTTAADPETARDRRIDMVVMEMATKATVLVARQVHMAGVGTIVAAAAWML